MTKSKFNKELKGFWNGVKTIEGVKIAHVGWHDEPWMIIENEETFEDAKEREFVPILSFRTRDNLWEVLNKGLQAN